MHYLLLFPYNNGSPNSSESYFTRNKPVFLSHEVVKLPAVWQLKIVPAPGENSIVTGSVKWELPSECYSIFLHCAIMTVTTVCGAVCKNSLSGLSLDLIKPEMNTRQWCTDVSWSNPGQQLSSSGWIPHRDVPFLTLVCGAPLAGIGQPASASFGWRLRMNELLNIAGEYTCIYTRVLAPFAELRKRTIRFVRLSVRMVPLGSH
jgi:hypothetical protein